MKRALISGVTGQDGSYLVEFLLRKGYEVHGLKRRSSSFNTGRIDSVLPELHGGKGQLVLHFGDLADTGSLIHLLLELQPDEVYHLGAQSHVAVSFDIPEYTGDITALGSTRMLEAVRQTGLKARFYNASSSEIFGNATEAPQRETTSLRPRSPYGCAKAYSYWMTINYRDGYGLFACNGILFNHESPRRGETFVSRKVTRAVARIVHGLQNKLFLGNLEARRDWGYAPEYVQAMWLMLQAERPADYIIATGENHTVREFVELAFGHVGLDWREYVDSDPRHFRPTEVDGLLGDASKAQRELGWAPKVRFRELVELMVDADIQLLKDRLTGSFERHAIALSSYE